MVPVKNKRVGKKEQFVASLITENSSLQTVLISSKLRNMVILVILLSFPKRALVISKWTNCIKILNYVIIYRIYNVHSKVCMYIINTHTYRKYVYSL